MEQAIRQRCALSRMILICSAWFLLVSQMLKVFGEHCSSGANPRQSRESGSKRSRNKRLLERTHHKSESNQNENHVAKEFYEGNLRVTRSARL